IRLAVSVVTCRQNENRMPLSGCSLANRARIWRSTGMDRSAHSVRRFPSSASFRSLMSYFAKVVGTFWTVMCSSVSGRKQILHPVRLLPGKEINLLPIELPALGLAAEMAIAGGRTVNRALQLQSFDDPFGREIEYVLHHLLQRSIRQRAGTERLHQDGHRLGDTDGVRDLHLAAAGQFGLDDVLGDPTGGVGRRTIHLRWVLPAKGAATVPGHPAVGV